MRQVSNLDRKSARHLPIRLADNQYRVVSGESRRSYSVVLGSEPHCDCEYGKRHQEGGALCSHVLAAMRFDSAMRGERLQAWPDELTARRQKKQVFNVGGVWMTKRAVGRRYGHRRS